MRLDLMLKLSEKVETIDVVGRAEVLKTNDASLGEVIETKSVKELPLSGRRLLDLALTVPGSHISHGAQTGDMNPLYWRPSQPSALSIGGGRPNANYFLLDSATNTDPTFNTLNLSPSPDAVLEFLVFYVWAMSFYGPSVIVSLFRRPPTDDNRNRRDRSIRHRTTRNNYRSCERERVSRGTTYNRYLICHLRRVTGYSSMPVRNSPATTRTGRCWESTS